MAAEEAPVEAAAAAEEELKDETEAPEGRDTEGSKAPETAVSYLRRASIALELVREKVAESGVGFRSIFRALAGGESKDGEDPVVTPGSAASGLEAIGVDLTDEEVDIVMRVIGKGGSAPDELRALHEEASEADAAGSSAAWIESLEKDDAKVTEAAFEAFCAASWLKEGVQEPEAKDDKVGESPGGAGDVPEAGEVDHEADVVPPAEAIPPAGAPGDE